ncbi:hypothetical protein BDQ12DRAFT_681465 [Crucibulum laeve]|uniref:F-box domain-containing protein n=1 Tax=Crucibulum laeve TaxID=68775 RepID=A0A5C3M3B4_9AGAR|nr:hypothetical protein BDQ12DRAFT_681465 [Crucibulum laeve]
MTSSHGRPLPPPKFRYTHLKLYEDKIMEIPTEMLTQVFMHLSYSGLLAASSVCTLWKQIIQTDPLLSTLLFKRKKLSALDKKLCTGSSVLDGVRVNLCSPVRLHPAISRVSYHMGEGLSTVGFFLQDGNRDFRPLASLPIAHDYISIPAVDTLHIEITPSVQTLQYVRKCWWSIDVPVLNPDGVTILDVFEAIVRQTCVKCDLLALASGGAFYQRGSGGVVPKLSKRAEVLGTYKKYTSFTNPALEGSRLSVTVMTAL